jgi:hypothetical protein
MNSVILAGPNLDEGVKDYYKQKLDGFAYQVASLLHNADPELKNHFDEMLASYCLQLENPDPDF